VPPTPSRIYEFGPFRLIPDEHQLLRDGKPVPLTPRPLQLLLVLVENHSRLLLRRELMDAVWPDCSVDVSNLDKQISVLRDLLGDCERTQYIKTVHRTGFRFIASVRETVSEQGIERSRQQPQIGRETERGIEPRDKSGVIPIAQWWHVIVSSLLYASLYAVGVLTELSYEFDRFRLIAPRLALITFLWILATSLAGLAIGYRLARKGKSVVATMAVFVAAAGVAHLGLRPFLPDVPSVRAHFQTYTIEAAYLKDTLYFLLLACIFWLPAFHFVASRRGHELPSSAPSKVDSADTSIPFRPNPAVLFRLWVGIIVLGILMLAHLFDNLIPGPHLNLFMQMVLLRSVIYFALGSECLLWYSHVLGRLKTGMPRTSIGTN